MRDLSPWTVCRLYDLRWRALRRPLCEPAGSDLRSSAVRRPSSVRRSPAFTLSWCARRRPGPAAPHRSLSAPPPAEGPAAASAAWPLRCAAQQAGGLPRRRSEWTRPGGRSGQTRQINSSGEGIWWYGLDGFTRWFWRYKENSIKCPSWAVGDPFPGMMLGGYSVVNLKHSVPVRFNWFTILLDLIWRVPELYSLIVACIQVMLECLFIFYVYKLSRYSLKNDLTLPTSRSKFSAIAKEQILEILRVYRSIFEPICSVFI